MLKANHHIPKLTSYHTAHIGACMLTTLALVGECHYPLEYRTRVWFPLMSPLGIY